MTEEQFAEWIFIAPDEEVKARGTVIRPGRVVRFKFDDASYILGLNSKREVAINGEFCPIQWPSRCLVQADRAVSLRLEHPTIDVQDGTRQVARIFSGEKRNGVCYVFGKSVPAKSVMTTDPVELL
jgi:hypothetical protein